MARIAVAGLGALLLLGACALAPPAAVAPAASERLILVTVDNPPEPPPARPGATPRAYDAVEPYGAGARARTTAAALATEYGLRPVAAWPIAPLGVHCVVFEIGAAGSREHVVAALARDARVRLAQPMQSFTTLAAAYNDPYVDLQRGFAEIGAEGAQQWSRGEGVRIAVVDTGIDAAHPDLAGRVALTRNFVDADAARFGRDRHGTAVAGVISSIANNREGIVGIAPAARLLALKACWQGDAGAASCNSFTLAQALGAAIEAGARVVNLSLGGPADPLLTQLVEHALARGIVVVAAVPPDGRLDGFPVGVPGVIAVDVAGAAGGPGPVLRAPGRDVITLVPGGRYDFVSGSSIAAAHVTGAVALLLADRPALSAREIGALLQRPGADGAAATAGMNVCAALLTLRGNGRCGQAAPAVAPGI
jgi:subtilisin family serine protease